MLLIQLGILQLVLVHALSQLLLQLLTKLGMRQLVPIHAQSRPYYQQDIIPGLIQLVISAVLRELHQELTMFGTVLLVLTFALSQLLIQRE